MAFSYFIKHKKNKLIKKHIEKFKDFLTDEQKAAILASLFIIANCDEEFHTSEAEFFEQFTNAFGATLSKNDYLKMDLENVFEQLNTLTKSQKEWYVITIFGMIRADRLSLQEELEYAKRFFNQMGIPLQDVKNILQKADSSFLTKS